MRPHNILRLQEFVYFSTTLLDGEILGIFYNLQCNAKTWAYDPDMEPQTLFDNVK